jgi:hypothetical protein
MMAQRLSPAFLSTLGRDRFSLTSGPQLIYSHILLTGAQARSVNPAQKSVIRLLVEYES